MYNWSVIHGIKRKPHLSVVWNWYHFVAIAILHQPRPTDSADINTRLQLSDTSSIPPMHGGFLLGPGLWIKIPSVGKGEVIVPLPFIGMSAICDIRFLGFTSIPSCVCRLNWNSLWKSSLPQHGRNNYSVVPLNLVYSFAQNKERHKCIKHVILRLMYPLIDVRFTITHIKGMQWLNSSIQISSQDLTFELKPRQLIMFYAYHMQGGDCHWIVGHLQTMHLVWTIYHEVIYNVFHKLLTYENIHGFVTYLNSWYRIPNPLLW